MVQILINLLSVFIVPFLAGVLLYILVRKTRRAWLLRAALLLLTAVIWGVALLVPAHGSELYGLLAWQASCLMGGSLITELVFRIGTWR